MTRPKSARRTVTEWVVSTLVFSLLSGWAFHIGGGAAWLLLLVTAVATSILTLWRAGV